MSYRKYFSFPPIRQGQYSKQAHVHVPEQTYEEEVGKEGFFGPVTHLYRKNPPTAWAHVEGDCRPQAYDFNKLQGNYREALLLSNRACRVSLHLANMADPTYKRNADGDCLHFIHEGEGILESDFGSLAYKKGDYLYIPRSTTYRFFPKGQDSRLVIEALGANYYAPDRGIMGQHALIDPGALRLPELQLSSQPPTDSSKGLWEIQIHRAQKLSRVFYDYNPLDVVGMKGDLSVFALNVADICPVMSHRNHLAPSVHSTFVSDRFVVCTFAPRPTESAEGAQRVPFWHRNVDYDEVIFYHSGDFFSRDNIRPGWLTFHPTGIHHGPHPKAFANQFNKNFADEYAVMIDTRDPLDVSGDEAVKACEWKDYWKSWKLNR